MKNILNKKNNNKNIYSIQNTRNFKKNIKIKIKIIFQTC